MKELYRFLDNGDFFESIENLSNLPALLDAQLPLKTKLSAAVGLHKHILYIKRYHDRFRGTDLKRGLRVSGMKIVQLLRICGEKLNPHDDSDLATLCQIIEAESLIYQGDLVGALTVLSPNEDTYATFLVAECLFSSGRNAEAERAVEEAKALSSIIGYIEPNWDYLKQAADRGVDAVRSQKIRSKRWLSRTDVSLKEIIRDQIMQWSGGPRSMIRKTDRIVTVGSCFALNVSYALSELGMDSHALPFTEEVNNTYVNRILFDKLSDFLKTGIDGEFRSAPLSEIHALISSANVLIFTCGTSIGFFDKNGEAVIPGGSSAVVNAVFFRENTAHKISVAENVANLRAIIAGAKAINPAIKIILTVSPVPLVRAFEEDSALIGDCISKSTLRVSIDELMDGGGEEIYYWPSFEMAKWIVPHYGLGLPDNLLFGYDDGVSRHASKEMVQEIIGAFLEYSMVDPADSHIS